MKKINKKLIYILFFCFFIVFFFVFLVKKNSESIFSFSEKNNIAIDDSLCSDDCSYRLIDGELVDSDKINPFIISAVIDNHSDARPQLSLSLAKIVYDIPAEGGINRYLAFFLSDEQNISNIGPIRSARPYFLDIAREYNSIMLHCGGSPEALARISKERLLTINEFYNEKYFFRDKNYQAPHNVVADFDKIKNYLNEKNFNNSNFNNWIFDKEKSLKLDNINFNEVIEIKKGQQIYNTSWSYDFDRGLYLKNLAGNKHVDNLNEQIYAKNLIFQFIDTEILDNELRLKIDLLGRGYAVVCMNGFCNNAYFQKNDYNSRTIYYYNDDSEVIFTPGNTWIHFIDEGSSLKIENFDLREK